MSSAKNSSARFALTFTWLTCAALLARLADGYLPSFSIALALCLPLSLVASRMRNPLRYSFFVMSSILLVQLTSGYLALATSSQQFFPPAWSVLDSIVLLMLWLSPILGFAIDSLERRCAYRLKLILQYFVRGPLLVVQPSSDSKSTILVHAPLVRAALFQGRPNVDRGPPLLSAS
jgi:hypothetical protein